MKPEIFMDDFERTQLGDELYSCIGRALTISTRFEAMCKTLNSLLQVKSNRGSLESEEEIQLLVNKIYKKNLATHINTITKGKGNDDLRKILDDARIARNEIAHEISLGLDGCIDLIPESEIKALIAKLKQLIVTIAIADKIVSFVISIITHELIPNSDFLESYEDRMTSWVADN